MARPAADRKAEWHRRNKRAETSLCGFSQSLETAENRPSIAISFPTSGRLRQKVAHWFALALSRNLVSSSLPQLGGGGLAPSLAIIRPSGSQNYRQSVRNGECRRDSESDFKARFPEAPNWRIMRHALPLHWPREPSRTCAQSACARSRPAANAAIGRSSTLKLRPAPSKSRRCVTG